MGKSRRQFLREGASWALGSAYLAGCQTIDRLVLGEYREDVERVTILGAGLAGLMAAYQLKKKQVPFQVFEASSRIGGRIHTVPDFLAGQPVAELGAEWFDGSQRLVFQVAQELKVDIYESKDLSASYRFRIGDKMQSLREIAGEMARLQRMVRKQPGDESAGLSLRAWIESVSSHAVVRSLTAEWAFDRFGTSAEKVPARRFIAELSRGSSPLGPWIEQRFRFRNGGSQFASALFERVAGFQPDRTFSFQHRCKAVRIRPRGYELYFDTPHGEMSFLTTAVICTVPLAGLQGIDGIRDLPGPWDQPEEFRMGAHAKFIWSYGKRFWVPTLNQSRIDLFQPQVSLWESSFQQNPMFQFRQGVLTAQLAGPLASQAGPQKAEEIQQQILRTFKVDPKKDGPAPLDEAMINWATAPLFLGSVSNPPLQSRSSPWVQEKPSLWQWAGEHVSEASSGTLQGALESAVTAVEMVARARAIRSVL